MKIYNEVVIDIASGEILEERSYEYEGPVALAKSQKSTTTVTVPPPTEQEKEAQELANLINLQSLHQMGFTLEGEPGSRRLVQRPLTPEEQLAKQRTESIEDYIYRRLTGAGPTEEERALVGETFQSSRDIANQDLERFIREQAGARGLSTSDSPVLKELGLAKARLETGLAGAEAASLLDIGSRQQLFSQGLREFQESLKQNAYQNRLALGESFSQTALGLGRQRMQMPTTTQTTSGGLGLAGQFGLGLGGNILGNVGTGLLFKGLGLGAFGSSREFKDGIAPFETEDYERILAELEGTPVYHWRYKPEFSDARQHLGPVTEESPKCIVSEDGKMLVPVDMLGFLFAVAKALHARVKALEAGNAV